MFKKTLNYAIFSSLLLASLIIYPIDAKNNADLFDFIKANTWESVNTNPAKDEEFQILVSTAKDKDIKKLKTILDDEKSSMNDKKFAIKALGLKKDTNSSAFLRDVLIKTKNKDLIYLSAASLVDIGGERNFKLVADNISKLKTDKDKYYNLLAKLAYVYKKGTLLSKFNDYLKVPPNDNMKAVYLFTIFGSNLDSLLFLNKSIDSKNKNIQVNSVQILGKWYAAPNAIIDFQDVLKSSNDVEMRKNAIIGLTAIGTKQARKELSGVLKLAKSEAEKKLASSSLEELNKIAAKAKIKQAKAVKYDVFSQEYSKLMNSKGFYGSYDLLDKNAKFTNISKLEKLRETIMLNLSKDAAINYQKVTEIIRRLRIQKEFL